MSVVVNKKLTGLCSAHGIISTLVLENFKWYPALNHTVYSPNKWLYLFSTVEDLHHFPRLSNMSLCHACFWSKLKSVFKKLFSFLILFHLVLVSWQCRSCPLETSACQKSGTTGSGSPGIHLSLLRRVTGLSINLFTVQTHTHTSKCHWTIKQKFKNGPTMASKMQRLWRFFFFFSCSCSC